MDAAAGLKRVLWSDAIFEILLGVLLATAMLTHLDTALPISSAVTIAFGVVLVPVGLGIFAVARAPSRPVVVGLALANAIGALVFVVWLGWRWQDFGPPGQAVVAATAIVLGVLAGAELAFVINTQLPILDDGPGDRGDAEDRFPADRSAALDINAPNCLDRD